MSFDRQHEIHSRRFGRNLGVAVVLVALVTIVFGLTVAKVTRNDSHEWPQENCFSDRDLGGFYGQFGLGFGAVL